MRKILLIIFISSTLLVAKDAKNYKQEQMKILDIESKKIKPNVSFDIQDSKTNATIIKDESPCFEIYDIKLSNNTPCVPLPKNSSTLP